MSKGKNLLKNTAIITAGRICTQLLSFLLLPLYTIYLSTDEFGIVDLLNTLTSLLIPILTFQVDQGIFRYLIDKRSDEEEKNRIITTVSMFLFFQIVIYAIVFLILNRLINNVYKYFLFFNLIITSIANFVLQITRGFGDNKNYAFASFISGATTIILNVILIVSVKMGAAGMLWAVLIGQLMCVIYIVIKMKLYKYIRLKDFDKKLLKEILKYSIPLIPNAISWWVVNASDRFIILNFLDVGQNGIYSVANKFSNIITTIYGIFNIAWTESAAENINKEDRDEFFSNVFRVTIEFFSSISLGLIVCIPLIFDKVINYTYFSAYNQIPILILATFFSILVTFLGSIYVANKITKEILKTSIITAIINIIINLTFISKIGLYAASVSTLCAWCIMFVYRYIDSKKYVKIAIDKMLVAKLLFISLFAILAYYINLNWLNIISAIVIIVFTLLINKRNIEFLKNIISKKKVL